MNVLSQANKDCKMYAELLGDYQSMSVDDLMNGYCKALDEQDEFYQNCYLSAVVLRFWYVINKLYLKCPNIGLEHADFFTWLVEAINYAAKYRGWQTKKITAQACINQCINTIRVQHYYEYNLDKHKANYNTMSLSDPFGDDEDQTAEDLLEAPAEFKHRGSLVDHIVQTYINSDQIIEAIIFDSIAYNDVNRSIKVKHEEIDEETGETKNYTRYKTELWQHKLVEVLGNLPDSYHDTFLNRYTIIPTKLDAAIDKIKKCNNQKLYTYIRAALADAKQNQDSLL